VSRYEEKKARLSAELAGYGEGVRLEKSTSNLFRARSATSARRLKVSDLDQVLAVDPHAQVVEVEGMTSYERLADACLTQACMPLVVPQLKSITIGGAVSGIGIESTSFRHGFPHESVLDMDVLLPDGEVVCCSPDNAHADLFFGLPNAYGTLGYVLKLTVRTMPVKPYVRVRHRRYRDAEAYFRAVEAACEGGDDFIDGTIFREDEMYLTSGCFTDIAPYTSDYTWLNMYFRSIRERGEDFLSVRDYLWRWDTDWFWCSKNVGAQSLPMRLILGRRRLNSVTYQRLMRWNERIGLSAALDRCLGRRPETVIQDVDIPIRNAPEFLRFLFREIGIHPVWMCPLRCSQRTLRFPLYPLHEVGLLVNFGFWDRVANPQHHPPGHYNRLIEEKVLALGGSKSLYSDSYYDEETFWKLYDGETYRALKARYDPHGRLRTLYEKCVLRA
jgi:FAD/FMN-containing dehydrogenase